MKYLASTDNFEKGLMRQIAYAAQEYRDALDENLAKHIAQEIGKLFKS